MAARTDAALAEVLASRQVLGEEVATLRASAREAVDIPAKIRRSPAKAAGVAAGGAFIVLGGPRRVFRRVRRAVSGSKEPLPTRMLPDEIEAALSALGDDGARVRGALERGFEGYLTSVTKQGRKASRRKALQGIILEAATPIVVNAGVSAAKRARTMATGTARGATAPDRPTAGPPNAEDPTTTRR